MCEKRLYNYSISRLCIYVIGYECVYTYNTIHFLYCVNVYMKPINCLSYFLCAYRSILGTQAFYITKLGTEDDIADASIFFSILKSRPFSVNRSWEELSTKACRGTFKFRFLYVIKNENPT